MDRGGGLGSGMKRLRTGREGEVESINLANVLVLLSRGSGGGGAVALEAANHGQGRVFECKTCNRRFPSFQALGGHRASHKKPRLGGEQNGQAAGPAPAATPGKPRVHECSICGLEFSIGQALGGHMRRHRAASDSLRAAAPPGEAASPPVGEKQTELGLALELDLNLPPSNSEADFRSLNLGLGIPMVDCFH